MVGMILMGGKNARSKVHRSVLPGHVDLGSRNISFFLEALVYI